MSGLEAKRRVEASERPRIAYAFPLTGTRKGFDTYPGRAARQSGLCVVFSRCGRTAGLATIRELQEATEALEQIKAIAEKALKERAYGSPEEARKITRVLEIATKALDDHDQAVPNPP
jgi:hypothetical protein